MTHSKISFYVNGDISDVTIDGIKNSILGYLEACQTPVTSVVEKRGSWYLDIICESPTLIASGFISWIVGKSMDKLLPSDKTEQTTEIKQQEIKQESGLINKYYPEFKGNVYVSVIAPHHSYEGSPSSVGHKLEAAYIEKGQSLRRITAFCENRDDVERINQSMIEKIITK